MRFFISFILFSSLTLCRADEVALRSGESLSGSITGITSTGVVNLDYVYADKPFSIIPSAVEKCLFHSTSLPKKTLNNTLATLTTGESFAGNIVTMDKSNLTLDTNYSGKISLPRTHIDSISFNQVKNRLIYTGPTNDSTWENSVEWSLEGNLLTTNSNSVQYNDIKLPQNFILKFTYLWQQKPNLIFSFCGSSAQRGLKQNRYLIFINKAGIALKRESAEGEQRWRTLAEMLSNPSHMPDKKIEMELRVDRNKRKIHVIVNGANENVHTDLIGDFPPSGSGISIEASEGKGATHTISGIEVYEWDAISQRKRSESRSSDDHDSMVDDSGEIYTGKALEIKTLQNKQYMIFDHPHAKDLIQIPLNRISMLYLKKEPQQPSKSGDITLHLLNDTHLSALSLELTNETAKITHPLLGPLEITKDTLKEITSGAFSGKEKQ